MSATDTAAGLTSNVPVVGSIVSGAIKLISGIVSIKGSTPHVSWDQASAFGQQYGAPLQSSIYTAYGTAKGDLIKVAFINNMIAFLENTDRWGEGSPQNKQAIINNLKTETMPPYASIGSTFWEWNMWAMQNVDASSTVEYQQVFNNDMPATLGKAIQSVTGVANAAVANISATGTVATLKPAAIPSGSVVKAATQAVAVSPAGSSMPSVLSAGFSSPWAILLIVGVGVGLMFYKKKA